MNLPLLLLSLLTTQTQAARPKNAILLSEVSTLTLRSNAQTTHRRVPPLPQLKCVSPQQICALHTIDLLRCTNQGPAYDPQDIQWSCTASLPDDLKLGSTDVICEGYARPDDEYVLKGSCAVEYRLVLTERGERRHPELVGVGDGFGFAWSWGALLVGGVFVAVLGFIVYSACVAGQRGPGRNRLGRNWGQGWGGGGPGGWGGGGGPGGWGPGWGPGNNDPPPPYPGKPTDQTQQGWQPGFWSGLAGGAAAGYMAGSRGQRNRDRDDYYERPTRYGGGGGLWGGGDNRAGPSSSSSSTRHESTGFGSTRRR